MARLAAATGAPVVPVGLWGTERGLAASRRRHRTSSAFHDVSVRVGPAVSLPLEDAAANTERDHGGDRRARSLPRSVRRPRCARRAQGRRRFAGVLSARTRLAVAAAGTVNRLSRRFGLGDGTVIGGRTGLAIAPGVLGELAAGRRTALVSGTNGKTTTTRLLAVALEAGGRRS